MIRRVWRIGAEAKEWMAHPFLKETFFVVLILTATLTWKLLLLHRIPLSYQYAPHADCPCRAWVSKIWLSKPFFADTHLIWLPGHIWLLGIFSMFFTDLSATAMWLEWVCGVFAVLFVYGIVRFHFLRTHALCASLLYLTIPAQNLLSSRSHGMILSMTFFFLGLMVYSAWLRYRKSYILLMASLLLSFACTVRYEVWLWVAFIVVATAIDIRKSPFRDKLTTLLCLSACGLFPLAFMFHMYVYYGHPLGIFKVVPQVFLQLQDYAPISERITRHFRAFFNGSPIVTPLGLVGFFIAWFGSGSIPSSSNTSQLNGSLMRIVSGLAPLSLLSLIHRHWTSSAGLDIRYTDIFVFLCSLPAGILVGHWLTHITNRTLHVLGFVVFATLLLLNYPCTQPEKKYTDTIERGMLTYEDTLTLPEYQGLTYMGPTTANLDSYARGRNDLRNLAFESSPDGKHTGEGWFITSDASARNNAARRFGVNHWILSGDERGNKQGLSITYLTDREPECLPESSKSVMLGPVEFVAFLPCFASSSYSQDEQEGLPTKWASRLVLRQRSSSDANIIVEISLRDLNGECTFYRKSMQVPLYSERSEKLLVLYPEIEIYRTADENTLTTLWLTVYTNNYQAIAGQAFTGTSVRLGMPPVGRLVAFDDGEYECESCPAPVSVKKIFLPQEQKFGNESLLLWYGRTLTETDISLWINGKMASRFPAWMFNNSRWAGSRWFTYRFKSDLLKAGWNEFAFATEGGTFSFQVDTNGGPSTCSFIGATREAADEGFLGWVGTNLRGYPGEIAVRLLTDASRFSYPDPPGFNVVPLNVDWRPVGEMLKPNSMRHPVH